MKHIISPGDEDFKVIHSQDKKIPRWELGIRKQLLVEIYLSPGL